MGLRFRYADLVPRRHGPGVVKRRQTVGSRERGWWIQLPPFALYVRWRPWGGLMPCILAAIGSGTEEDDTKFPNLWSARMKRLTTSVQEGLPLPPLSGESVVFKKFSRFREFMAARVYEDGSPRKPGRVWIESDNIAYTATLFEQSGFGRMRFRAQTLDDLLTVIEAFLAQEQPQWEDDQFARDRAAEKNTKKKRA